MKLKIKIESLGCRLNQSEIESISTTLQNMGHSIVFEGDADIYIINSCAVTLRSERKTRQLIYRAMDQIEKNSGKGQIIVTGCATDSVKQINDIIYVPNDHKYLIPDIITKELKFRLLLLQDLILKLLLNLLLTESTSRFRMDAITSALTALFHTQEESPKADQTVIYWMSLKLYLIMDTKK